MQATPADSPQRVRYFLSYAHTDLWHARQIADFLRAAGHHVDFGTALTGDDAPAWQAALTAAISANDAFLYILSPDSAAAGWCRWEFAQAAAQGKPALGVLLEALPALPAALSPLPSIDLTQGLTPENSERLLNGLKQAATINAVAPVATPSGKPARAETLAKHVFLSYSRRDTDVMRKTRDVLRAAQIPVWTDESIAVGTPLWTEALEKAIENAGCVLVLLSPDAKQSSWVKRELEYASALNIPITPVLARGTEAESVPFRLIGSQYLDVTAQFDERVATMIATVRGQLQGEAAPSAPAVTATTPLPAADHARRHDESFWEILFKLIRKDKVTPFLGPAINSRLLSSHAEAARKWAELRKYPFEAYDGDLARVAQFLAFEMGEFLAKEEIIEEWLKRGKTLDFNDPDNGYSILASLPVSFYVTTNYDDYLCAALDHRQRAPKRVYYYDDEWVDVDTGDPTPDQPMVMHLYGHQTATESLVLTEDDYLRHLLKFTRKEIAFPNYVTDRLARTSYIFIGFTASEWSLRTLFQILSTLDRKGREPHIAIQVEPIRRTDSAAQQERVEEYLRNYFRSQLSATNVQVYVEETDTFLVALRDQWATWKES